MDLEALLLVSAGPSEIASEEATREALVEEGVVPVDAEDVGRDSLDLIGSVYI